MLYKEKKKQVKRLNTWRTLSLTHTKKELNGLADPFSFSHRAS